MKSQYLFSYKATFADEIWLISVFSLQDANILCCSPALVPRASCQSSTRIHIVSLFNRTRQKHGRVLVCSQCLLCLPHSDRWTCFQFVLSGLLMKCAGLLCSGLNIQSGHQQLLILHVCTHTHTQ